MSLANKPFHEQAAADERPHQVADRAVLTERDEGTEVAVTRRGEVPVRQHDTIAEASTTRAHCAHVTFSFLRRCSVATESLRQRRQDSIRAFDQRDLDVFFGIDPITVGDNGARRPVELGGQFRAGGARADDATSSCPGRSASVGLEPSSRR